MSVRGIQPTAAPMQSVMTPMEASTALARMDTKEMASTAAVSCCYQCLYKVIISILLQILMNVLTRPVTVMKMLCAATLMGVLNVLV